MPLKRQAAIECFYNDLDDDVKAEAAALMCEQSRTPFEAVINYAPSQIKVPKIYILCKEDETVPPIAQELAVKMFEAEVVEVQSGHFPFLKESTKQTVVDVIVKAAET